MPLDHWTSEPTPLRQHDLYWSRTFPQYVEASREAGLRRYWREYNAQARQLAERYAERFLLLDTQELTTEAGVRRLLDFCGFPWSDQKPLVGKPPAVPTSVASPRLAFPDPMDPRRCVVLVPFTGFIHQECDLALRELERRGYAVRRVAGYAAIDQLPAAMTVFLGGSDDVRLRRWNRHRKTVDRRFVEQGKLTGVELVGPRTIHPLQEQIETMRELIVATTFVLNGRQQFADQAVQHSHILRQMFETRGSVRHDRLNP